MSCQTTVLNVLACVRLPVSRCWRILGVLVEAVSANTVASFNKGSSLMIGDALDSMFERARSNDIHHICWSLNSLTQAHGFYGQLSGLSKHFLKLFNKFHVRIDLAAIF